MSGEGVMSVPVWVLLAYAGWTMLTLFGSVGVYRWSRILTGRAAIAEWVADKPQGSDWYRRAMRAHMNCVENLPIYAAVVIAIVAIGAASVALDVLAVVILAARIAQTLVHITVDQGNAVVAVRFALFLLQVVCTVAMGILVMVAAVA